MLVNEGKEGFLVGTWEHSTSLSTHLLIAVKSELGFLPELG